MVACKRKRDSRCVKKRDRHCAKSTIAYDSMVYTDGSESMYIYIPTVDLYVSYIRQNKITYASIVHTDESTGWSNILAEREYRLCVCVYAFVYVGVRECE